MTKSIQQNAIVIVVSILFIGIPFINAPEFNSDASFIRSLIFLKRCISSLLIVIYFYINYYIFVPCLYRKKKYISYLLLTLFFLFIIIKTPELITANETIRDFFSSKPEGYTPRIFKEKPHFLLRFFFDRTSYQFYLAFTIGILLKNNEYINSIEKDILKTEVSYLKAQINPHFLFNTLNSIYALALMKSNEAPEAILKLSSIMRYVVTESSKDKVELKEELKYISDYIELQKLRLTNLTTVDFEIIGYVKNQTIAPLIFISFIENCFKYGVSQNDSSTIKIRIKIENNSLILITSNKKVATNISELEKTETGIGNTKKRLAILYPDNYELKLNETEQLFEVVLKMNIS